MTDKGKRDWADITSQNHLNALTGRSRFFSKQGHRFRNNIEEYEGLPVIREFSIEHLIEIVTKY
jgi:hypothetical protein